MLSTSVIGFITTVLLPKFIKPEEFGLFALGSLVMAAGQRLVAFGQTEFIISRKGEGGEVEGTVFSTYLISNLALLVIQVVLAGYISTYFNDPRLKNVLYLLAAGYLITPFMLVPGSVLSRDLDFKKKFWPELAGVIAYTIIALGLVAIRPNVYTLIVASLCSNAVTMFMLIRITKWKSVWGFKNTILKQVLVYGAPLFLTGILSFLCGSVDRYSIGKILNSNELGYYAVAFQLVTMIPIKISSILATIAFPAYSMISNNNEEMRKLYLSMLTMAAGVGTLVFTATFTLVRPLIELYYGAIWASAIGPAKVIALFGFGMILSAPIGGIFLAIGKTKIIFINALIGAILNVLLIPLVAKNGILWVAITMTTISWANIAFYLIMAAHLMKITIKQLVLPLLICPAVAALAVLAYNALSPFSFIRHKQGNDIVVALVILLLTAIALVAFNRDIRKTIKMLRTSER